MVELTSDTVERLELLFGPADREQAAALLREQCADNLPFMDGATPQQLERIRFAVLKLAGGRLDKLRAAVREAQIDWRDVLVAAGFAEVVDAHRSWMPGRAEA